MKALDAMPFAGLFALAIAISGNGPDTAASAAALAQPCAAQPEAAPQGAR